MFWSCGMKMLHGICNKLEDSIKIYLIKTYHRLCQEYIKSYRIAFRVALWLFSNKYPATYSFIGLFFGVTVSKLCKEFDTKFKVWIKRYLIETWHRLSQGCFESYKMAFRVALWLDFGQLSSYFFVNRRLFRVTIWKCYIEFDTNWRIESRDILFKLTTGYLKSISCHIE